MKTGLKLFFLIALACTFYACVTPMGMTSSSTPLEGKKVASNLGKAEGRDSAWSVLGLWSIGRPDIDKAIEEAVKSKNGDAIINVRWYEKTYYFVFASYTELIVYGDVIKFEAPEEPEKAEKNAPKIKKARQ